MKKRFVSMIVAFLMIGTVVLVLNVYQTRCVEPVEIEWDRTYGGVGTDGAASMVPTSDGGYAMTGASSSFGAGQLDLWLVKTDHTGDPQWNKTYGGSNEDTGNCIIQTSDGGYAVAGRTKSFGAGGFDFWLVKWDKMGNVEWNKTYGGVDNDQAFSVIETLDGGYAMTGFTKSYGAGSEDFWLVKVDVNGNHEWDKTYGDTGLDHAYTLLQTAEGNYTIIGRTTSYGAGENDFWLIRTNSTGHPLWHQTYGGPNREWGQDVIQTFDGGYALTGETNSYGAGNIDMWLVKTDAYGNMMWSETYGGPSVDHSSSLAQTVDGGYIIAGVTNSYGAGSYDGYIVKTNTDGAVQWTKTLGGSEGDATERSIIQTSDGGYAVTGHTSSFGAGKQDFWLIKLAPELVSAIVDIDPNTLNLKSRGRWISCYIELPESHNVSDVDISTILLNNSISVDPVAPTQTGDVDEDGIPDLMVKFDRDEVILLILSSIDPSEYEHQKAPYFIERTLELTGELVDGTMFEGHDTIRVTFKHALVF